MYVGLGPYVCMYVYKQLELNYVVLYPGVLNVEKCVLMLMRCAVTADSCT